MNASRHLVSLTPLRTLVPVRVPANCDFTQEGRKVCFGSGMPKTTKCLRHSGRNITKIQRTRKNNSVSWTSYMQRGRQPSFLFTPIRTYYSTPYTLFHSPVNLLDLMTRSSMPHSSPLTPQVQLGKTLISPLPPTRLLYVYTPSPHPLGWMRVSSVVTETPC